MKKILVNFANDAFADLQTINSKSGLMVGGFDEVRSFKPSDMSTDFRIRNQKTLSIDKGAGLWLWKPYFIRKALNSIDTGDLLFYCDSGSTFINNIDGIINTLEDRHSTIGCFDLVDKIEAKWTKSNCLADRSKPEYFHTSQRLASFIMLKKSNISIEIINDFLNSCEISNNINEENVISGVRHRHDQSVWSLLTKIYDIKSMRDPSQFGKPFMHQFPDCHYEVIIDLHRLNKPTKSEKIKSKLSKLFRF